MIRPNHPRFVALLLALTLGSGVLAACTGGGGGPEPPSSTLTVLAGSELKDLEPLLPRIQAATGIKLELNYTGTIDGAQQILNGTSADLAWFSSGRYLTLAQGSTPKVLASTSIMLSPVVLGVKRSVAQRFGWENNPDITWQDVADKVKAGAFHYAMTNPAASNSGFSALIGVSSAFAGTGNALRKQDINVPELTTFFSGQTLTAGSSGFLSDAYVRSQSSLDGMINYESILLELNASGSLKEPLDLVYPKNGIVTADYPLMLLNPAVKAQYDKLAAYLRTPDIQRWIMTNTDRRPVIPQVKPDSRFPSAVLLELPFPSTLPVVNTLISTYLNEIRPPSHAIFVLDVSGSMQGARLASLQKALTGLTGLDNSLTGQFAQFRDREDVTFIAFSDHIVDVKDFTIDTTDPNSTSLTDVRAYVQSLQAGGSTAIYSALDTAYRMALSSLAADPTKFTSIVLMTDGENNRGMSSSRFLADLHSFGPQALQVRTFPVLFGEASPTALQQIATETGGQVFDGRSSSLSSVFKDIRGYQ